MANQAVGGAGGGGGTGISTDQLINLHAGDVPSTASCGGGHSSSSSLEFQTKTTARKRIERGSRTRTNKITWTIRTIRTAKNNKVDKDNLETLKTHKGRDKKIFPQ